MWQSFHLAEKQSLTFIIGHMYATFCDYQVMYAESVSVGPPFLSLQRRKSDESDVEALRSEYQHRLGTAERKVRTGF